MSSRPDLKLDWCSHQAAKYAVEHWHYSGSMPTPPYVRCGVWEDGEYIGCVLFSRGALQNAARPHGLTQVEQCELTRIALRDHRWPVSRIVSVAIRLLRARCPGVRLVVSYADPGEGHVGAIYQAGGWVYAGQRDPTVEFISPHGKRLHGRMVSPSGKKRVYGRYRAVWRPSDCTRIDRPGKHKYLMPLDDEMRQRILPLAKPYPKRETCVTGADSGTAVPTAGGGANPTVTLQEAGHGKTD